MAKPYQHIYASESKPFSIAERNNTKARGH